MNFSYDHEYRGEPVLPVVLRSIGSGLEVVVDAVVDTGSNVSVFERWIGEVLAIDLSRPSDLTAVTGIGGVLTGIALAEIEVEVFSRPDLRAVVFAAFLPQGSPPIGNLLGTDVLEVLDFGLSHSNHTLYLGPSS